MKTDKHEGLWKREDGHGFRSRIFNKENLPDQFRIFLFQNPHYRKDSNRPKYIFFINDATLLGWGGYNTDSLVPSDIVKDYVDKIEDGEIFYTSDDVKQIAEQAIDDMDAGYGRDAAMCTVHSGTEWHGVTLSQIVECKANQIGERY